MPIGIDEAVATSTGRPLHFEEGHGGPSPACLSTEIPALAMPR